jgi:hypothetical protein
MRLFGFVINRIKRTPIPEAYTAPRKKVFCGECARFTNLFDQYCEAPGNLKDTHEGPNAAYSRTPQQINRDNNCGWFKRKKDK